MREQYLREAIAAGPHVVNRLRELLQWEILAGLHRAESFRHIAFVGGTCLRLLHGLHRFSEDLDFSMISSGEAAFLTALPQELQRHLVGSGFHDVEMTSSDSPEPSPPSGSSFRDSCMKWVPAPWLRRNSASS